MCVLVSQPLRQSSYHACIWARISLAPGPSALVPTPCDDDGDRCFACTSDWALAPLQLRSNESAKKLGNVRIEHRLINCPEPCQACAATAAAPIGANTDHRRLLRLSPGCLHAAWVRDGLVARSIARRARVRSSSKRHSARCSAGCYQGVASD